MNRAGLALAWCTITLGVFATPPAFGSSVDPQHISRHVSPQQYQQHLRQLEQLIASCSKQTADCLPSKVGEDDTVTLGTFVREVRYGWMRNTLYDAANANTGKARAQAATELTEASARLRREMLAPIPPPAVTAADLAPARSRLSTILAEDQFSRVHPPSAFDRWKAAFLNWLNAKFGKIAVPGSGWRGLAILLFILLCLAAAMALVWWSRRWRQNRSPPAIRSRGARQPVPVDAERWLGQARALAGDGRWREAVHDVYWGAITLLESRGNWPRNRARTPREYLACLSPEAPTQARLAALTGMFERTWYGNQPAGPGEFDQAWALVSALEEP